MNNKPLISVVVPVYNVEKYLNRCINSVLNQTYKNIEIILVNDGSSDNSLFLCNELQKQFQNIHVIDKPNGGLGSARNAGLKVAKGDFIAFLDSDDWVSSDCYEYMLNLLLENDADVSDIRIYQVESENDYIPEQDEVIEVLYNDDILYHYLHRGMSEAKGAPYSVCRKLYKMNLFDGDTSLFAEGTVNEDICFNYRILRKCSKIVISNQIKYFYYQGNLSITNGSLRYKDLALKNVSIQLVELAKSSNNKKIIKMANLKEARSNFSLLARIARDGIDQEIVDPDSLISDLIRGLRKKILMLLLSPMPTSRKILALMFATSFKFTSKLLKLYFSLNN